MKKLNKYADTCLSFMDSGKFFGKPFLWIFTIIAVLSLLVPVLALVGMFTGGLFNESATTIIGALIAWLFIALAGYIGFKIWWNRKNAIQNINKKSTEFIVIPLFSHFIQTLGESLGFYIAIVGLGASLVFSLFSVNPLGMMMEFDIPVTAGIFIFPLVGFFTVVLSRAFAESIKAMVTIAINTKK